MNNRKRTIILLITGTLAFLIGFFYFSFKSKLQQQQSIFNTLPKDAIVFYAGTNLNKTIGKVIKSESGGSFLNFHQINKAFKQYINIDSLISNNSDLSEQYQDVFKILSLHKTAIDKLDFLFLIEIGKNYDPEKIIKYIPDDKKAKLVKREFKKLIIYDFQINQKESFLAFAQIGNYLSISKNPMLVEDAIRTYKEKSGFSKDEAKGWSNKLMINYNQLKELFGDNLDNSYKQDINNLALNNIGVYDVMASENHLALRGSIQNIDSSSNYFSLFTQQSPKKLNFSNVVSSKSAFILGYNISDFETFYKKNLNKQSKSELQKIATLNSIDVDKDLLPLFFGPFIFSITEPIMQDLKSSTSLYVRVFETQKSISFFTNPSEKFSYVDTNNQTRSNEYKGYGIYKSYLGKTLNYLFTSFIDYPEEVYFINIRDYLIFANNEAVLKRNIDDYINNKTLKTSSNFYRFSESLSTQSNLLIYVSPSRAIHIPDIYLSDSKKENYNNQKSLVKNYNSFAFQISAEENTLYNEIILSYEANTKRLKEYLWKTELDTLVISKPYIVKNHNDNTTELLVFDSKNNMYLLDAGGKILWKKPLDSKFRGNLYQVDLYNNQKLQYLFSTNQKLYLVDRLGRDVANYPIGLSSSASCPLSAYDMYKNNEYNLFIGCDNKYVFGYDLSGKPIDGWNPNKLNGNMVFPLKYFIKNNLTYLLGYTDDGLLYVWFKSGSKAIKPIDLQTKITNPFQIQFEKDFDNTHLISVDTTGKTHFIYMSGKTETKEIGKWTDQVNFTYMDVNGDGEKELIYADQNLVNGYNHSGELVFSTSLEVPISTTVEYIQLQNKYYIAYINTDQGKLYLVDFDGNIYSNFPIDCSTAFSFTDLDKDGVPEVIGIHNNSVFVSRF